MGNLHRPWEKAYLASLAEHGLVMRATREAGVGQSTVWRRRKSDPDFEAAVQEAMEVAADKLEAEARRRAVFGVEEPVIYQGQPTYVYEVDAAGYPIMDTVQEERPDFDKDGKPITRLVDVKRPRRKLDANGEPVILTVRKHSDTLLALLLKGRRKGIFAERTELTGADGGPVQSQQLAVLTGVPQPDDDAIA